MYNVKIMSVTDGEYWPNLIGVFSKRFSVVCSQVENDGISRSVTYYGDVYQVRKG